MSASLNRRVEREYKKSVPEPDPDMTGWMDMEISTWHAGEITRRGHP